MTLYRLQDGTLRTARAIWHLFQDPKIKRIECKDSLDKTIVFYRQGKDIVCELKKGIQWQQ